MKTYRNILKIDLAIQVLLVGFPLVALLLSFILSSGDLLVLALMDLVFIGAWQLLSGLVLAIGYNDKLRMKYLLFAGLYLSLGIILPYFFGINIEGGVWILGILVSYGIAFWYLIITYQDLQRAKTQLESFWDLKI